MGINIELPNVIIRGTEASAIKIQFVFALFTFPATFTFSFTIESYVMWLHFVNLYKKTSTKQIVEVL